MMTAEVVHRFQVDCEDALAQLRAMRDLLRDHLARLGQAERDRERQRREPKRPTPTGGDGSGWDWRLYNILTGWTGSTPGSTFGRDEEEDNL